MNDLKKMPGHYQEIISWVIRQVETARDKNRPLVIGINGPQGSGKSTLTAALVKALPALGLRAITVSIDDFYLTRSEQVALAKTYSSNPYLQQRGYPGTHDVELGKQKLLELRSLRSSLNWASQASSPAVSQSPILIPIYDKSKFQGQGDRLPELDWARVQSPLDVVFLEGWMLGFKPVADSTLAPDHSLKEINPLLLPYASWNELLDGFICLIPREIQYVVNWRVEAEERMKAHGKPGMSRDEITSYIRKFILAYETYLPQLTREPLLPGRTLSFVLAQDRTASLRPF